MWPSTLPDSSGKTILFLGFVMIFFGGYQDLKYDDKFELNTNKIQILSDSLNEFLVKTETLQKDLIKQSDLLSIKYNVKNPITFNDLTTFF